MRSTFSALRVPAFGKLADGEPRQRAGQLAGRDRARGPGLRSDGKPDGDGRPLRGDPLPPRPRRTAARRPARAPARPVEPLAALRRRGRRLRRRWRCWRTSSCCAAVLVLAAIDGSLASAARSLTRAAAAGALKPAGLLREGNAVLNIGFTAGAAIGPAVAGLVVAGASVQVALLADAVSFLAVAALLATARGLCRAREPEVEGVLARLRSGLAYVRREPAAAPAAGRAGHRLRLLRGRDPDRGRLREGDAGRRRRRLRGAAGELGRRAWSSAASRSRALRAASIPALLAFSTLAIGVAYLGTAARPDPGPRLRGVRDRRDRQRRPVGGLMTAVQAVTAGAYQARVVAMLEAIASAMPGVGFVIGGAVAALADPRAAFAVAGAGVLVVLLGAVVILRGTDWRDSRWPKPDLGPPQGQSSTGRPGRRRAGFPLTAPSPAQTQAELPESAQIWAAMRSCSAAKPFCGRPLAAVERPGGGKDLVGAAGPGARVDGAVVAAGLAHHDAGRDRPRARAGRLAAAAAARLRRRPRPRASWTWPLQPEICERRPASAAACSSRRALDLRGLRPRRRRGRRRSDRERPRSRRCGRPVRRGRRRPPPGGWRRPRGARARERRASGRRPGSCAGAGRGWRGRRSPRRRAEAGSRRSSRPCRSRSGAMRSAVQRAVEALAGDREAGRRLVDLARSARPRAPRPRRGRRPSSASRAAAASARDVRPRRAGRCPRRCWRSGPTPGPRRRAMRPSSSSMVCASAAPLAVSATSAATASSAGQAGPAQAGGARAARGRRWRVACRFRFPSFERLRG